MTNQNVVPIPKRRPTFVPAWTLGDRFRKARQIAGMDQRAFAQQLGCSPGAIAQWETGVSKPRELVVVANQVQSITGVSASWLLGIEPQSAEKAPTPKGGGQSGRNLKFLVAPRDGLEPSTCRYQAGDAEIIAFPARTQHVDTDADAPLAPVTALFGGAA